MTSSYSFKHAEIGKKVRQDRDEIFILNKGSFCGQIDEKTSGNQWNGFYAEVNLNLFGGLQYF